MDWLYGIWEVRLKVPKNVPQIAQMYVGEYTVNVCVQDQTTYWLRIDGTLGFLDWYGPFKIKTAVSKITPNKQGFLVVQIVDITPPTTSPNPWPLKHMSKQDLVNTFPIVIDPKSFKIGINFYSFVNFFGHKGCSLTPVSLCVPQSLQGIAASPPGWCPLGTAVKDPVCVSPKLFGLSLLATFGGTIVLGVVLFLVVKVLRRKR